MGISTKNLFEKIFRRSSAETGQPTSSKPRKALQSPAPENNEINRLRKAAATGDASAIIALKAIERNERRTDDPNLVARSEKERATNKNYINSSGPN